MSKSGCSAFDPRCWRGFQAAPRLDLLHFCVLLLALVVLAPVSEAQQPKGGPSSEYELIELPLRPLAVSNSQWVSGTTSDQKAARWSARAGLERIPLPSEFTLSEGLAVNLNGDTVGTASTADSSRRAGFVFRDGTASLLPGEQASAEDINDSGEIVGQARLAGKKAVGPALWRKTGPLDLGICCAGTARRINGAGLIVGDTYDSDGHYHAFLWTAAQGAKRLDQSGEGYSSVVALNARGTVLLRSTPAALWLYAAGRFTPLNAPQATPRAMNNDEVVVGSFGAKLEGQRAFVWDKTGGMRDLNALIPPDSGWTLEVATGINDRGEIVGWGDHRGVENAGFLLRPRDQR